MHYVCLLLRPESLLLLRSKDRLPLGKRGLLLLLVLLLLLLLLLCHRLLVRDCRRTFLLCESGLLPSMYHMVVSLATLATAPCAVSRGARELTCPSRNAMFASLECTAYGAERLAGLLVLSLQ